MNTLLSQQRSQRFLDDASTGSQRPPRISIDNNQFTLIDPSGAATQVPNLPQGAAIDIVIVDINQHMSKLFWGPGRTFNRTDLAPPQCWSDNGVAPSSLAQAPQHPTCGGADPCPHNIIGSAVSQISGARIKACQDFKKLAVIVKGFAGVYMMEIKPGSFKSWNNYTAHLRLQKMPNGAKPDLCDVVTRVTFVGRGVLGFEAVELVEGELAQQVIAVWDKNQQQDITGLMIGRFDQPAQNVLPVTKQAPQQPPPPASPPPAKPILSGRDSGGPLFPQPPAAVANGTATETDGAKAKRGRPAKEAAPAQAAPAVTHGLAQPTAAPAEVVQRLNALFPLPKP